MKGYAPRLIIHSGTHGDEYHVIEPLRRVVTRLYDELPDFIYVPEVSPSAVSLKSRINAFGNDLNRIFWDSRDPEAFANKQILAGASHAIALSFHEDIENNAFYIYDTEELSDEHVAYLRSTMKRNDIPLLTGFDDPHDVALSHYFVEGYAQTATKPQFKGPFVDDWARYHSHVSRMLTIEVPYTSKNIETAIEACLLVGVALIQVQEEVAANMVEYAS